VLAHLFDTGDLQSFSAESEDKPMETVQIDCPLVCAVAFERVAAKTGQSAKLVNTFCAFDDRDALNIFARDLGSVCPFSFAVAFIASLELVGTEFDFHGRGQFYSTFEVNIMQSLFNGNEFTFEVKLLRKKVRWRRIRFNGLILTVSAVFL